MKHRYLTLEDIKEICQPKKINMDYRNIDMDGIYKKMMQIKDKLGEDKFLPENTQWEEDGEKFSSWTFKTPTLILHTGDGGAGLMMEAFENEIKNNKF